MHKRKIDMQKYLTVDKVHIPSGVKSPLRWYLWDKLEHCASHPQRNEQRYVLKVSVDENVWKEWLHMILLWSHVGYDLIL